MNLQKIVVLGTGGTIAGRSATAADTVGYAAAEVGIDQLLAEIPKLAHCGPIETEQVAQIDSKDMSFAVWAELARRVNWHLARPEVQAVVITHGTDTLEETAFFLQRVCNPSKPVVLTCAMRPTTALVPDGPQNLLDALTVARQPGARGVVAVCAGAIHSAEDVQKIHTYRLDAFSSGDAVPLGYIEAGVLRLVRNWPSAQVLIGSVAIKKIANLDETANCANWPRVEIVTSHAGASGLVVEALLAQGGVHGLVVAATGNGTVHHALEAALRKAQAAGVQVIRATRCAQGRVIPTPTDVFPSAKGLSPVKARIDLMLSLLG